MSKKQTIIFVLTLLLVVAVVLLFVIQPVQPAEVESLLVVERKQITKLDYSGESEVFVDGHGPAKSLDGEVYVHREKNVIVYDATGKKRQTIPIPPEVRYSVDFVVLPDGQLAFLDNRNDAIYFVDVKGNHLQTVRLVDEPDGHFQNMDGVVVGNKLIVSENGHKELIEVDLDTYEVSLFRSLKQLGVGLGAILYSEGRYYICQRRNIYSFTEDSVEITKVATTPESNITGIVSANGRLFAVVNGMSKIKERGLAAKRRTTHGILYEIDPKTGKITQIRDGLNYPGGLLVLRSHKKEE